MKKVAVVGAGLAGAEAAYLLAFSYGVQVDLYEMKRKHPTPAQEQLELFAELVCSNGLKSLSLNNPAGVLKVELAQLGSLVMQSAYAAKVPAGESLAVDRTQFSTFITEKIKNQKKINILDQVVNSIESLDTKSYDKIVIATGPLTHDNLAQDLIRLTGCGNLYFYDAIAPIIDGDTIDFNVAYWANRERKGTSLASNNQSAEGDYLNLPLTKQEYVTFVEALLLGDKVPFHNFEEPRFFNGCQPIEALAESGLLTLAHGPLKGRGLTDPKTGRWPYACVQLRKESLGHNSFNMVGFQTRLTWPAQRKIFRTLPGLANVEFHRMGSMHRNTYLISPQVLNENFSLKANPKVYLAGQIMGVEGYLESAAMGNLIAHIIGHELKGVPFTLPPKNSALGALAHHVLHCPPKQYTPMNIHWGLFDDLSQQEIKEKTGLELSPAALNQDPSKISKINKFEKRTILSNRAQVLFKNWQNLSN